jgi:photosystem II stability/assembly factor-like uncharacterized protein
VAFNTLPDQQLSVIYTGHGVALISLGAPFNSASDVQPRLYLSEDLVHWRDITPHAARAGDGVVGDVNLITQASWISPTTGWIETCRNSSYTEAIFQTTDGGRRWQPISDPSEAYQLRCADSIQLLSHDAGIETSARQEGLGGNPVEVTHDDGRTWTAPYGLFHSESTAVPDGGVAFETVNDAMAPGSAPYGLGPGIQISHDGGATWSAVLPPAPAGADIRYNHVAFGDNQAVLPVMGVNTAGGATVQLDVSNDGGSTWTVASQVSFHAEVLPPVSTVPTTTGPTYQEYVNLSITEDGTWWLTLPTASPTTVVSTDQGHTWTTLDEDGLPPDARATVTIGGAGLPLNAFVSPVNAMTALATGAVPTTSGASNLVYRTQDRGKTWTPVHLPPH